MSQVIYGLRDPRTREIRYIGKTDSPRRRLADHLRLAKRHANNHVQCWIRSLFSDNVLPEMIILENGIHPSSINEREIFWINNGRQNGWRLTNLTSGGDGISNPTVEIRAKISSSLTGKHHTAETRARMSASHRGKKLGTSPIKGRPFSDEHRAKIGSANKGKIRTEETKKKLSDAHKGKRHSAESIAKRLGKIPWNKGKSPSAETRAKISESLKGNVPWNKGKPGKPPWNKGKPGKPHSAETRAKMSLSHKRIKRQNIAD